MIELTEPQVWTAVGVLSASFMAMVTVVPWLFVRILRAEIGGLDGKLSAEIRGVRTEVRALDDKFTAEIRGVRTEVRALDEKFTAKLDHLDRDVQAVVRKVFPTDP